MFKRLRLRLTVVCALSTSLVLVGMAVASFRFSASRFREQADSAFTSSINSIVLYLQQQTATGPALYGRYDAATPRTLISQAWLAGTETQDNLLLRLDSPNGTILYTSQSPVRHELTALALETAAGGHGFDPLHAARTGSQTDMVRFTMQTAHGNYRAAVVSVPVGRSLLCLTVLRDMSHEEEQVYRLKMTFALFVLLAMGCLVLVSRLMIGLAVRPVEESRRRQTEFVAAASHEIRSPLAIVQASAEGIPGAPHDRVERYAQKIIRECGRLSRLTDDLLRLAGADSNTWSINAVPAEPDTLLLSVVESWEAAARRKRITLRAVLPEGMLPGVSLDPQRMEQLLSILVDNALSYTPSGGQVRLEVTGTRKQVCFLVADSGPGVPPEQRERIFERFFRGDEARTDREHYGLGLSIALEITRLHRGSLQVGDAPEGGAQFTVTLPV